MIDDAGELPTDDPELQPTVAPTNIERLRSYLTPNGIAIALMDVWKSDDPGNQSKMLDIVNSFHDQK